MSWDRLDIRREPAEDEVLFSRRMALLALRDRCKADGNYCLSRLSRWFYTLKCVLCMMARPESDYLGETYYYRSKGWVFGPDPVDVAIFNMRSVYSMDCWSAYDWETLKVGHGVFRNWRWRIDSDGSC